MTYLLDSSALVAHALGQAGAVEVQSLFEQEAHDILLSAVSLFELAAVLKREGVAETIPICWDAYQQCAEVLAADGPLVRAAWQLREAVQARLPMADAIIAATAQARQAVLVHRDEHLAEIPESLVPQLRLPNP